MGQMPAEEPRTLPSTGTGDRTAELPPFAFGEEREPRLQVSLTRQHSDIDCRTTPAAGLPYHRAETHLTGRKRL